MEQITLNREEYERLMRRSAQLDKIERQMIAGVNIRFDNPYGRPEYHISIKAVFTTQAREEATTKIINIIKDQSWLMEQLVRDNAYMFSFPCCCFCPETGYYPDEEVNMLEYTEFKQAWDNIKNYMAERQEEF